MSEVISNAEMSRRLLKTIVRGAYDVQKIRIQVGNRIMANFRVRMGQKPGTPEATMDQVPEPAVEAEIFDDPDTITEEDEAANESAKELKKKLKESKEHLELMKKSYRKMMDAFLNMPKPEKFVSDGVIHSFTEFCLIAQYMELEKQEKDHFKRLGLILPEYDVYNKFLSRVPGCGPAMSGVMLSEFNIEKADTVSKLWKYAGLAVMGDGKGQSKRAEHLVDKDYKAKDGTVKTKKSITFNPFLKTKLVGVLGSSFLRARGGSPYAGIYYGYINRLQEHPRYKDVGDKALDKGKKAHRHRMAIRYMVKMFLIDLYKNWRACAGLPVRPPFREEKLGMPPHAPVVLPEKKGKPKSKSKSA